MAAPTTTKPVIAVPFYSMYGHIATLAEEVVAGIEAAGGIAKPYFIEETLPAEVLEKMHAGASLKPKYPLLEPAHLTEVDGFIFGIPTRYGRAPSQVSAFFDKTGGLWASQALSGKYATTFTSTASQHGGQELTHLTTMPFFVHHGCIYVPIGYKEPYLSDNGEVHGASPWGVSTVANGDGSRVPTEGEKRVARFQGEVSAAGREPGLPASRSLSQADPQHFTKIVAQAVRGRQ
jgi:NAD(P)H dehydrogenase (quinone)